MYRLRLWSVRHARSLEVVYDVVKPAIVSVLGGLNALFGRRLDRPVTAIEATVKGLMFDCTMCGDCVLNETGMSCPMNCPKNIRNGPCGGVRENGMCEVKPQMVCVWVAAWDGSSRMKNPNAIKTIQPALDHRRHGTSSWLRLARKGTGNV
ncbi:MAG: hypothetical protein GXP01_07270 [Alphaproteobacteria bacterium]|nr:hypothetical protein [Alphaproteobacteria bacterium]